MERFFFVSASLAGALAVMLGAFGAHALREQLAADLLSTFETAVRYHLFHATRAELLRDLGRPDEARAADRRALELTDNPAERALLERRLA